MTDPKETIYSILTATGYAVSQRRPEVVEELPSITFYLNQNTPDYDLDKEIGRNNIRVVVDLWAETSSETSTMLSDVVEQMLANNYLLTSNLDVDDPEGVSHINLEFTF